MATEPASPDPLETAFTKAFAPMHKRALGVAFGATVGAAVFLLTVFHILIAPPEAANIELLSQYFYGYHVSWGGALIGTWWGFVAGFVGGWFLAFTRNFSVATWVLFVRVRTELFEARDFLDHI
jgi:hypothetical protein